MSILITHPGRHGDVLWAMASVKAIHQARPDDPITLLLPAKYGSLKGLLECQSYIAQVIVLDSWEIEETAPITPRVPPVGLWPDATEQTQVFHLGYAGWPSPDLPRAAETMMQQQWPKDWGPAPQIDLSQPWITATFAAGYTSSDLAFGFTDEHFELKYGLFWLWLERNRREYAGERSWVNLSKSPRWQDEGVGAAGFDWTSAANFLARSRCFVGCCSALHVLSLAIGCPTVVVEPNRDRWNPVFWPEGLDERRFWVMGGDGLPTVDSRHVGEAIEAVWMQQAQQAPKETVDVE